MSEPRFTERSDGVPLRVDAILRELAAGDGHPDMRARVLEAIHPSPRHRPPAWLGAGLAACLALVAAALVLHVRSRNERALARDATAETASTTPPAPPILPLAVGAADVEGPPPGPRSVRRPGRRTAQIEEGEDDDVVQPLVLLPIGNAMPLALEPLATASLSTPEITVPAIEIATLSVEPPSGGSF